MTLALPSQRGINPTLMPLLGLPERVASEFGPRDAAEICEHIAADLWRAVRSPAGLGLAAEVMVSGADLETLAEWLAGCAASYRRIVH